jgi:pimeloyl-CoA synthetase
MTDELVWQRIDIHDPDVVDRLCDQAAEEGRQIAEELLREEGVPDEQIQGAAAKAAEMVRRLSRVELEKARRASIN